jgi:hypothetical protein
VRAVTQLIVNVPPDARWSGYIQAFARAWLGPSVCPGLDRFSHTRVQSTLKPFPMAYALKKEALGKQPLLQVAR